MREKWWHIVDGQLASVFEDARSLNLFFENFDSQGDSLLSISTDLVKFQFIIVLSKAFKVKRWVKVNFYNAFILKSLSFKRKLRHKNDTTTSTNL